jgi:hypothetical protein
MIKQTTSQSVYHTGATKEEQHGPVFYVVGGPTPYAGILESFILTTFRCLARFLRGSYFSLADVRGSLEHWKAINFVGVHVGFGVVFVLVLWMPGERLFGRKSRAYFAEVK